jgi:hypothetical protein
VPVALLPLLPLLPDVPLDVPDDADEPALAVPEPAVDFVPPDVAVTEL